jgi:hypothetical protein
LKIKLVFCNPAGSGNDINVFDKIGVEDNGRVIQSRKPDREASLGNIGGFAEFITGN